MTARIEVAASGQEISDAQREARALHPRIAGRQPGDQVKVNAGTLRAILRLVDAVSLPPDSQEAAACPAKAEEPSTVDEISPQAAAGILGMSRPSVMRLIERGLLHPRKVLSRNKLSRAEVIAYWEEHSRQQRQALDNLAALVEEHDF